MISKGTIVTTLALVGFGWLFFSSIESEGQRYERLRDSFPRAFCEDASRLVGTYIMLEEQYRAYQCSLMTLAEHSEFVEGEEKFKLLERVERTYPTMTEPWCWTPAIQYLTGEMQLHEYYELGCDLARIPSDDVFKTWLSQR